MMIATTAPSRGGRRTCLLLNLAARAFLAVTIALSVLQNWAAVHNQRGLSLSGPSSSSSSTSEYISTLRAVGVSTTSVSSLEDESDILGKGSANDSPSLPRWIDDYVLWHDRQLKRMNKDNWKEFRYLVFRCLREEGVECGGASDRIQSIPYGLLLANQTRRVLLIEWTRPCRLEEFLVPPPGGINWTVPSFVDFQDSAGPVITRSKESQVAFSNDTLVGVRYRVRDGGKPYYDAHRGDPTTEPDFETIYHRVWRVVFTPSPSVAALIREAQRGFHLVPNQYVSVHIRAMYTANGGSNATIVENAIHCATQLRPGLPIFLASDSRVASSHAIRYGRHIGANVVAQLSDAPPLHLDRGPNFLSTDGGGAEWMRRNASDFYDTFVDLYLLAGGSCTAFNIGGYGRWANRMSSDSSCFIRHHEQQCAYRSG